MNISQADIFLANEIRYHLANNLGEKTVETISNRLNEKGYSITEAIKLYYPFKETLREFYGHAHENMMQKLLNESFTKITSDTYKIQNSEFTSIILATWGNADTKILIDYIKKNPGVEISEILEKSETIRSRDWVFKTLKKFIEYGLISKNKKQYQTSIKNVEFKVTDNVEAKITFNPETIKNSQILRLQDP